MATEIKSNRTYGGRLDALPGANAPLPADAVLYGDFRDGVFVTQGGRSSDAALCFSTSNVGDGWYWGADGEVAYAPASSFARIDHDPCTGERLGLLLESVVHNYITSAQRQDAREATALNCTVTRAQDLTPNWLEWFLVSAPVETAEKSLTFTGRTVYSTRKLLWQAELRLGAGSARYIQMGINSGDARDYVNFDLEEGKVVGAGWHSVHGYLVPTREGFRCWITCVATTTTEADPYVCVVDAPDAGRRATTAASGQLMLVRHPHFQDESPDLPSVVPMAFPFPQTSSDTRSSDSLRMLATLVPDAGDFSLVMRARSPEWGSPASRAAFCLYQNSVLGVSLQSDPLGVWELRKGVNTLLHKFESVLMPGRPYAIGLSRDGNRLRVILDGEEIAIEDADVGMGLPRFGRGLGAVSDGWGGHLQRVVAWDEGATFPQLRQRLARLI